jgi:hypothetical protein
MSYKSRPRLRTRHLRNKCALCREVATRFIDVGPVRVWLCATHFKENENGKSKETDVGS